MRAAVDCREKDQGDVRKQIVAGNACEESQAAVEARRYR